MEHTPMSPEMLTAHMAIGRSKGVPCIVRCSGPDHYFIKWVLDAGADAAHAAGMPARGLLPTRGS